MTVDWKEYHHININREQHARIVNLIKDRENHISHILEDEFRNDRLPRGEMHKLINHFMRALENRTSDSISLHWVTNHITDVDEQTLINLALPRFLTFCNECPDDFMQVWRGNFILQDVIEECVKAPYDVQARFFTTQLRDQFYDQLILMKPDIEFTKEDFIMA